jgi:hypothetical protein
MAGLNWRRSEDSEQYKLKTKVPGWGPMARNRESDQGSSRTAAPQKKNKKFIMPVTLPAWYMISSVLYSSKTGTVDSNPSRCTDLCLCCPDWAQPFRLNVPSPTESYQMPTNKISDPNFYVSTYPSRYIKRVCWPWDLSLLLCNFRLT